MAQLKSIFLQTNAVIGFGAAVGAQFIIKEEVYDDVINEALPGAMIQNVVIPQSRLSSTITSNPDGIQAIHIKNGTITVLVIDVDMWNSNEGAKFENDDIYDIHAAIIAIKQN